MIPWLSLLRSRNRSGSVILGKTAIESETHSAKTDTQGRAAAIIASGRLNLHDLISDRVALSDIGTAFLPGPRNGKTVILP